MYLKLLLRAEAFDPTQGSAMGWLVQIARHASIDWVRARARAGRTRDGLALEPAPETLTAEQQLVRQQEGERAVEAMNRLEGDSRDQVRAAFFDGLTYAQLAARDGLPAGHGQEQDPPRADSHANSDVR